MEKLIHERLRESLGKLDDCCNISSEIINHLRSDLGLTEDQKSYANDLRNIINYIADQVEKYYIPRPRFEDGEPVQFGDVVRTEFGNVECVAIEYNEYDAWVKDGTDNDWNSSIAADMLAKSHRLQKVLDADGVETKAGDTVYTKSGIKYTVEKIGTQQCEGMEDWDGTPWIMFDNGSWMHAHDVTHREPDSLEKLRDEIQKDADELEHTPYQGTRNKLNDYADRLTAIMERDA